MEKKIAELKIITGLTERQEVLSMIKKNNNCFLYFTATWCNPCKYAKPIIFDYVKLLKEKNLDFKFIMIDADEGRDVSSCMKVRGFPTLQFYHGSELHETCLGAGEEDLKAFFNASYHKML